MTITSALTAIAAVVAGVSGIKRAPDNPMENINEYPFALIYVMDGAINIGPIGTKKSLINIAIDLLTVRRDISLDMAILTPYLDSLALALVSELSTGGDQFTNTISTFGVLRLEFLPIYPYAGAEMIGYRFVMEDVKLLLNL
jgi:hypothetical protein